MNRSAFHRRVVAAACALGISACSGHQNVLPAAGVDSGAAASALGLPFAQPEASPQNATMLFVGNLCQGPSSSGPGTAINAFPATANGNVFPSRTIKGAHTSLNGAIGLSISDSRLWAVKSEDANNSAVLAFGVDANGDVAPSVKITLPGSSDWSAASVVQDPVGGDIFVADVENNRILVFAKNANGATAPLRIIAGSHTGLSQPSGIFLAPSSQIGVVNAGSPGSGGGSGSGSPPTPSTIEFWPANATGNVAPTSRIAGAATGLSAAHSAAYYGGNLYVGNSGFAAGGSNTGQIAVFAAGASGNVAPIHAISGAATGLGYPWQIAIDSLGNVYAANYSAPINSVTVYAAGSFGNVAPIRSIAGSNTGLLNNCPQGLAVGHVSELYVPGPYPEGQAVAAFSHTANGYDNWISEITGSGPALAGPADEAFDAAGHEFVVDHALDAVLEYPPGATGAVAPISSISGANTHLSGPNSIGLDAAGDIYVSNSNAKVLVFAAGAHGNVAPVRTITGAHTLIVGSAGELVVKASGRFDVVSSGGNNILEFSRTANGNVAPTRTISGSATGMSHPIALAADGVGRLYEANATGAAIRVFASTAAGNAAPIKTITGTFDTPRGLAVDKAKNVYLSDCDTNAVYVYGPTATGSAPPLRELGGADHRFSCPLIPAIY